MINKFISDPRLLLVLHGSRSRTMVARILSTQTHRRIFICVTGRNNSFLTLDSSFATLLITWSRSRMNFCTGSNFHTLIPICGRSYKLLEKLYFSRTPTLPRAGVITNITINSIFDTSIEKIFAGMSQKFNLIQRTLASRSTTFLSGPPLKIYQFFFHW
jgi:hypothetical protein